MARHMARFNSNEFTDQWPISFRSDSHLAPNHQDKEILRAKEETSKRMKMTCTVRFQNAAFHTQHKRVVFHNIDLCEFFEEIGALCIHNNFKLKSN